jgi:hypothetical protein
MVHAQIGMVNEAVVDIEKAVALAGRDETGIITLAHAYAASGRGNRAHRILGGAARKVDQYAARKVDHLRAGSFYVFS